MNRKYPVTLTAKMDWNKGIRFQAIPWDGQFSMAAGRGAYACPICGIVITGPVEGEVRMVHQTCIDEETK